MVVGKSAKKLEELTDTLGRMELKLDHTTEVENVF